jgi:hypothetical protein
MTLARRISTLLAAIGLILLASTGSAGAVGPQVYFTLHSAVPAYGTGCLIAPSTGPINYSPCSNQISQLWHYEFVGGGRVRLVTYSGYCATPYQPRSSMLVRACGLSLVSQEFILTRTDTDATFESVAFPGQCVQVDQRFSGYLVLLWDCSTLLNQRWHEQY